MGLLGLTGPPDGGQCGVGVWRHQQPGGHRRRIKMTEQSPGKPAARGQGEDPGETEGSSQGDGRRSKGPAAEGDHRSGPQAGCQDEVMEKGQGSHTLRIQSGLCRSDFSRVVRVEIRSQE